MVVPVAKRVVGQLNQTSAPAPLHIDVQPCNGLFPVRDDNTNIRFLVDTGAEYSVLPAPPADSGRGPRGLDLQAANNSSIRTYGQRMLTLSLALRRDFDWIFFIATSSTLSLFLTSCLLMTSSWTPREAVTSIIRQV